MRIISKFHDFYDKAMSYGMDLECLYLRDLKELETSTFNIPYSYTWTLPLGLSMMAFPVLIGFAGKIYPMVRVEFIGRDEIKNFYNAEDYITFINETINGIDIKKSWSSWRRGDINRQSDVQKFFKHDYSALEKMFIEHHVPIFAIHKANSKMMLYLNPSLQKYSFFIVKDPATTFQDIFMFLAGVLGNKEVDTVQIDDRHMLKQKGFDNYSFKTMKGDKKPRAKNRGKDE